MTRLRFSRSIPILALLAALPLPLAARADTVPVGRATMVQADVRSRTGAVEPKVIRIDDSVLFQDQILTGRDSKAILEFRDGSTLELGPNAVVTIDRFVFDPEAGTREKVVSISRGVFRMATGLQAPNSTTQIKTPLATIGIRGSVVGGIVPGDDQPMVLVGGTGQFTVTNGAGTSSFTGGQSVAVGGRNQAPSAPGRVPDAVAAAVIQAIQATLGVAPPPAAPPSAGTQLAIAQANAQPLAQQQAAQQTPGVTPQAPAGAVPLPPIVLAAGQAGLLSGSGPLTPAQSQAAARLAGQAPGATQVLGAFAASQTQLNARTGQSAMQAVLAGLARVMPPQRMVNVATTLGPVNPGFGRAAGAVVMESAIRSGDASLIQRGVSILSAGDPAFAAQLANQIVLAAERLLPTDPATAVQLAALSVDIVGQGQVPTSAPPEVSQTLLIASRIVIRPEAQRVNPRGVSDLSARIAQIATIPAVYGAQPANAIQTMANAYAAATSPTVLAAAPGGAASVVQTLTSASASPALAQINTANGVQIADILARDGTAAERAARAEVDRQIGAVRSSTTPIREENPDSLGSAN